MSPFSQVLFCVLPRILQFAVYGIVILPLTAPFVSSALAQGVAADAKSRLAAVEQKFGPDHLNTAMALQTMAEQLVRENDLINARPLLERALIIRKAAHGHEHPLVFQLEGALARLLLHLGERKRAVELLETVLTSSQKMFGDNHMKTAQARVDLAYVQRFDPDRQEEVVDLIQGALPVLESNLWDGHLRVAEALDILASADFSLGNLEEAEAGWQRALRIREDNYGSDHPKVAEVLRDLGRLQVSMRKIDVGEESLRRSVEIMQRSAGENAPSLADSMEPLAELLVLLKRFEEALPFFERILAIREEVAGVDSPRLIKPINDLALVHMELERFQEAKAAFRRAIAIADEKLGSDHIQMAFILGNLSEINQSLGDKVQAQEQFERSLEIADKFFAGDDLGLANWLSSIAATMHKSGRLQRAGELFNKSLALVTAEFGSDHPSVKQVERSLQALQVPIVQPEKLQQSAENKVDVPAEKSAGNGTGMTKADADSSVSANGADDNKPIQEISAVLLNSPATSTDGELSQSMIDKVVSDSLRALNSDRLRFAMHEVTESLLGPSGSDGDQAGQTVAAPPENKNTGAGEAQAASVDQKVTASATAASQDGSLKPAVDTAVQVATVEPEAMQVASVAADIVVNAHPPINAEPKVNPSKGRKNLFAGGDASAAKGEDSKKAGAKELMVSVGCFKPETFVPKRLMEQFDKMDLPHFSQATLINKKIHSCISVGPLMRPQEEVEKMMADIKKKLGIDKLDITELVQ